MRGAPTHASSDPLLLGLLGLGAVGLLLLGGAARGPRATAPPGTALTPPGGPGLLSEPAPVVATAEREPVLRGGSCPRPDVGDPGAAPRHTGALGARKEREFLAAFLALEDAQPGALEARAEAVLAGDGPPAEKVALLRALGEAGSQEQQLRWLEHAVRSLPDDSGPHGVSVASFALGELVDTAPLEREARTVLGRLAFETRGLASGLRRSAAVGLARNGDELELGGLRVSLARESDELLVAGVLAALSERPECPQAARLLQEFSPASRDD